MAAESGRYCDLLLAQGVNALILPVPITSAIGRNIDDFFPFILTLTINPNDVFYEKLLLKFGL